MDIFNPAQTFRLPSGKRTFLILIYVMCNLNDNRYHLYPRPYGSISYQPGNLMENQQATASLLSLKKGSKARIVEISDGSNTSRLMLSHGLRVGSVIDVLQQRKRGVVIASGATRIALGPDMASKLQVQTIN